MSNVRNKIVLLIALVIVSLSVGKYATSSWRKYQMWEMHKSFFELPLAEQKVQTWMSPNFVQRHYDVDLHMVMGAKVGFWEARKPLSDLCSNQHIDCRELIAKLNIYIKSSIDKKAVH